MELFYQRLRRLRLERGLKIKDVANSLKVSTSTYRDWEYGRSIKGEPYSKLAKILGVSIEELLTGKNSTPARIRKELERCENALANLKKELESFF